MNAVVQILAGEIKNRKSRFVFPSETASSRWARKLCEFTGERSVALNRFLAWDRFKETIIRSEVQDKEPVSSVIRKLFAENLVKRNALAAGGQAPLFRSLIPPEYAQEGRIFSASIAAILPSLGFWEARRRDADYVPDDEDRDFIFLKNEYTEFLSAKKLFEPSWEHPPLRDKEHQYYIFFPEAMEDFTEYESLLSAEPSIHIINIEGHDASQTLRRFDSARAEIRSAVLEIRRFHQEEGIPCEDMAISVPGLEDMEPYLLRELSIYNIPVNRRAGKCLAEFGTGKLFALISSCAANNFSFPALKSLLLNEQLPWRYPKLNRALIEFGIQNNCVSPYREDGRPVDIWLEAFRSFPREERLRQYYQALKSSISAITAARSFGEVRRRYFAFRGPWEESPAYPKDRSPGFLSREACSGEGDAALARCIEELSSLIQIEADYPDLIPLAPFTFYLSLLKEKQYVPQGKQSGVSIFPYRVGAAAPFACHFVLNASQHAATVLYQPLKFLRHDKRKRLHVADADVSAAFFSLYWGYGEAGATGECRSHLRISASERTFSGWAIPHSFFSGRIAAVQDLPADPFLEERAWWANSNTVEESPARFPARLFPVQKEGFDRWSGALLSQGEKPCQFLSAPFPRDAAFSALLRKRIQEIQERPADAPGSEAVSAASLIKVSATDLTAFFFCPGFWLCRKIWNIEPFTPDAKLLDDQSLGSLYHAILKKLFARIQEEDRVFIPGHMTQYYQWIDEYTQDAARHYPAFQGPLAVPLLVAQSKAIARKLRLELKIEAEYFAGYAVAELESSLEFVRGTALLNGRLDRVSIDPGSVPVIIDYKTGAFPSKKESSADETSGIRDFQMPMYVKLYEEHTQQTVGGAFFISINQRDLSAVIGSPKGKQGHSREAYQPTLDAFDGYVDAFRAALEALDFSPREIRAVDCSGCVYKNLCRTAFFLNHRLNHRLNRREDAGERSHAD